VEILARVKHSSLLQQVVKNEEKSFKRLFTGETPTTADKEMTNEDFPTSEKVVLALF
jgi:hypothetical protein